MAYKIEAILLAFGEIGSSLSEEVVAEQNQIGPAVGRALYARTHDAILIEETNEKPHSFETHEEAESRRLREYRNLPPIAKCEYLDAVTGITCGRWPVVATVTYDRQNINNVCAAHAQFYLNLHHPLYVVNMGKKEGE